MVVKGYHGKCSYNSTELIVNSPKATNKAKQKGTASLAMELGRICRRIAVLVLLYITAAI
jgi:hypothetical protein